MVKLFVGGLPFEVKEMDLAKLFIPYGNISTIKVVRDRQTRKCKGYAFIEMADQTGADQAIEGLNGTMLEDRALTVHVAEEKPAAPAPQKSFRPTRPKQQYSPYPANDQRERVKRPRKSSRID